MNYTPAPPGALAELEAKTLAEPPPEGFGWSIAWDRRGRRVDLDALVPVRGPSTAPFPAILTVYPPVGSGQSGRWLAATLPDDRAVPGVHDRLNAYLGTPNPERDA